MKYKLRELPKGKCILPPEEGWKPHTVYLVRVSFRSTNPVFRAILHTGFVEKGKFMGYCSVWCNTMDETPASECFYLEAEQELCKLGARE